MHWNIRIRFGRNRILLAAGILLSGLSAWRLGKISAESRKNTDFYKNMEKAVVEPAAIRTKPADGGTKTAAEQEESFDYRNVRIDFDALKEENEDIVGWILFDKNGISYPVLKGEDNEEYLYLMADGTENPAGSIFMDALCSPDFTDSHTIIYGHNMKDFSMFGKLKNYRISSDYYTENKYFTIYTPQQTLRYVIFSWYEAAADDRVYQVGFTDGAFGAFAEDIGKRGLWDTKITAGGQDKVITLSTCSADQKRFVVHGKLIYKQAKACYSKKHTE